jgi:flagellar hook-length control protein FliK
VVPPATAELRRTDAAPVLLSAVPAAPGAPAAPPSSQIVQQLGPLLEGPDGSYAMSLQLYPEELGAVQVEVALRLGEISLTLRAGDEAARETLRAALPDLRSALEAAGLTADALSVDNGRPDQQPKDGDPDRSGSPTGGARTGPGEATPVPQPSDPDAALDLRM